MLKTKMYRLLLLVITAFAWLIVDAHTSYAQIEPDAIEISYTTLTEIPGQEGVQLELFFTPYTNGKPVKNAQFINQQLALSGGAPSPVTVQPVQGAFSLVLVLDASGSMGRALPDMKKAVQQLIDALPDDTTISIYQFNDTVVQLTDFITEKDAAKSAIDTIKAPANAATCLYDAALAGVEKAQSGPRGRRAMILFTDGRDEKLDRTLCSTAKLTEVIQQAKVRDNRVPIYAVGLQGSQPIAEADLRSMAQSTAGAFAIGTNVSAIFAEIRTALESQLRAVVQIYPKAGEQTAQLNVTTQSGKLLTVSTTFLSPRDYSPKATPVALQLEIDSVTFDRPNGRIIVDTQVRPNESGISEYEFRVTHESGELLARYPVAKPLSSPLVYPLSKFIDGKLTVELRAFTIDGQVIVATREIAYLSPTAAPLVAIMAAVAYDPATDTITLKMQYQNREQIKNLTFNILDSATNTLVQAIPQIGAPDEVKFIGRAVGLKAEQKYIIEAVLESQTGQIGALTPREFTYQPPSVIGPTTVPVTIAFEPVQIDRTNNRLNLVIRVENESEVESYDLRFVNTDSNQQVAQYSFPAPLSVPLPIALDRLQDGKLQLTVSAQRKNGTTETAKLDFALTNVTPTPLVIRSVIDTIAYDAATDVVKVSMLYDNQPQIRLLRVTLTDDATGTMVGNFERPPEESISFNAESYKLEASKKYRVTIIPVSAARILTELESTREFVYTPNAAAATTMGLRLEEPSGDKLIIAPQFSNAAIVSRMEIEFINKAGVGVKLYPIRVVSPTIELDIADIPDGDYTLRVVALDATNRELVTVTQVYTRKVTLPQLTITQLDSDVERQIRIQLQVTNPQPITSYRVTLVNSSNINVQTETVAAPPYDLVQVNTQSNVAGGEYTVRVEGFSATNQPLALVEQKLVVPILPGLPQQMILSIRRDPLPWSLVIFGLIGVGFFLALRSRKAPDPFERQSTPAIAANGNPGNRLSAGRQQSAPRDDRTGFALAPVAPASQLEQGPHFIVLDDANARVALPLSDKPFTIGRRDADYVIAHDTVSRVHMVITYENEKMIATDQSSYGTYWRTSELDQEEKLLNKGEKLTLRHNMILRIGIMRLLFQWKNQPVEGSSNAANMATIVAPTTRRGKS